MGIVWLIGIVVIFIIIVATVNPANIYIEYKKEEAYKLEEIKFLERLKKDKELTTKPHKRVVLARIKEKKGIAISEEKRKNKELRLLKTSEKRDMEIKKAKKIEDRESKRQTEKEKIEAATLQKEIDNIYNQKLFDEKKNRELEKKMEQNLKIEEEEDRAKRLDRFNSLVLSNVAFIPKVQVLFDQIINELSRFCDSNYVLYKDKVDVLSSIQVESKERYGIELKDGEIVDIDWFFRFHCNDHPSLYSRELPYWGGWHPISSIISFSYESLFEYFCEIHIKPYINKLKIKKKRLVSKDDYGDLDTSLWEKECAVFISSKINEKVLESVKDSISSLIDLWIDENRNILPDCFVDEMFIYYHGRSLIKLDRYYAGLIERIFEAGTNGLIDCVINTEFCDSMTGRDYEFFVAEIVDNIDGWSSSVTQGSGDHGADVFAEHHAGFSVSIQCKKHKKNIGNKAVQEVYSSKEYYECNFAVVVTNSSFTKQAKQAANKLDVCLLHHDELDEFLLEIVSANKTVKV
mgnify:CR=1 FL=1